MRSYAVAAALLMLPPLAAEARTETCREVTAAEIANLFDRWNASLASGDPAAVVANYADDAILLPTVSNVPRLTREARADYFDGFLRLHPQGRIDQRVVQIGCNTALDTGLYTFTFGDGRTVRARYTFTYRWAGDTWLISSHHSSVMPQQD